MSRARIDVLFLCNTREIGGAQMNAAFLAEQFAKKNLSVSLAYLFDVEDVVSPEGVETFVFANSTPRSLIAWVTFFITFFKFLWVNKPKYIIGFHPASNVLGALSCLFLRKTRLIASQRNPSDKQSRKGKLMDKVLGCTPLYSANIAVSNAVLSSFENYPKRYQKKLRVVLNATPPLPTIGGDKSSCRQFFSMPLDKTVLGCIGRLHEQKNFAFALQVFSMVNKEFFLYIAGCGPQESMLKQLAIDLGVSDRVVFIGNVSGESVGRFYRSVDILLFTSIYEGFGRVLVESMSQSLPLISSDIAIAQEVAGDAAIFLPFDKKQWAECIEELISNRERYEQLVEKGLAKSKIYSIDAMVNGYLDVIEE